MLKIVLITVRFKKSFFQQFNFYWYFYNFTIKFFFLYGSFLIGGLSEFSLSKLEDLYTC